VGLDASLQYEYSHIPEYKNLISRVESPERPSRRCGSRYRDCRYPSLAPSRPAGPAISNRSDVPDIGSAEGQTADAKKRTMHGGITACNCALQGVPVDQNQCGVCVGCGAWDVGSRAMKTSFKLVAHIQGRLVTLMHHADWLDASYLRIALSQVRLGAFGQTDGFGCRMW
jgi:hypothetical protein